MSLGLEKLLLSDNTQKRNEKFWSYKKEEIIGRTPSRLKGMDYAEELRQRREAVRFLKKLSETAYSHVNMHKQYGFYCVKVLATSAVWFHRFFMVHPLQVFYRFDIAVACFYLASKAEDFPVNLNTITIQSLKILDWFGESVHFSPVEMEEEIKDLENIIMQTLGFTVWVKHPHLYFELLLDQLIGDPSRMTKIQQLAAQYATDSLGTTFSLRIDPRKLAIIFITWACNDEGFTLNNWKNKTSTSPYTHWLETFKLKLEEVNTLYNEYKEYLRLDYAEKEEAAKILLQRTRLNHSSSPSLQKILSERRHHQEPIVDKNDNFQFDFNATRNTNTITF